MKKTEICRNHISTDNLLGIALLIRKQDLNLENKVFHTKRKSSIEIGNEAKS